MSKCGTYAGWNHHKRYNEPVCTSCKEAARQYQKNWRTGNPEARRNNEIIIKAGLAAKRELAKRHATEYRKLYQFYKKQLTSIDA